MKWWHKVHRAFYLAVFFLLSFHVLYAQEGLVPQGRNADYNPDGYGICELVDLVNNIILFIIGLLALFAVISFMYAGFMMITSQGSASQISQAKGFFANTLIGAAIMFAAYLIINTVLSILLSGVSGALGWQTVECSYSYDHGEAKYEIRLTEDELDVIVSTINSTNPGLLTSAAGACSDGAIGQVWGPLANAANCVITAESACGASPISRTDVGADGNPFSYGAMQINMTVHRVAGCGHLGIPDMNCRDAWSGSNYSARVTNQALFNDCRAALLNNECNMINGKRIYKEAGNSWRPWSTAAGCGLR